MGIIFLVKSSNTDPAFLIGRDSTDGRNDIRNFELAPINTYQEANRLNGLLPSILANKFAVRAKLVVLDFRISVLRHAEILLGNLPVIHGIAPF
ncbi:hypothetical protein WT27_13805 [Burkholderia territorii]|uniref:Uncharacterized protein n=1 Tax=Burkholderia territorii TaxID=1503055 RepID=A0A106DR66_9BURK|nr:hypothetical protein WT27_13805 [Burkholderia territorii]KVX33933.1 hypothetical protein WT31_09705 [Burkholderia territorii]